MSSLIDVFKIHPADNVAIALKPLACGAEVVVEGNTVTLGADIDRGHKFALEDIAEGGNVIKYGAPIGHATQAIACGEHVHSHNLKTNLSGVIDYKYEPKFNPPEAVNDGMTFDGYVRDNGEVGIRNELWIIPTVGCINKTAENLAKEFERELKSENIDGVFAYPHPYGCSQLGDDNYNTQKILASLVRHPNAGGVLVVALGCENNTMESFREVLGPVCEDRVKFMVVQEVGDEMEVGLDLLRQVAEYASKFKREPVPVSKLKIGLKCGASDGFSGITANPLVGRISDMLIARGGTSVLSEVPEMFGAETLLMERCESREVFDKCVNMINGFKDYFMRYNQTIYENPSPGNKKGGISSLEEKSLGCTQKGGSGTVVDVLEYGDRLSKNGLNLLTGPGNDIVAETVLTAAGAHMVLFTTGRGTPLGAPVPTLKISTNTELFEFKSNWIDFNAGTLVEGESMNDCAVRLLKKIISVASGEQALNEKNGYREIAILKDGVTL
jgi:altronate hydrolase